MSSSASVWLVNCSSIADAAPDTLLSRLSDSERQRYARFLRPLRRRQFLAGRILLRQALGELLALPGTEICLEERPGNAPQLATPYRPELNYSLSHSGDWVACAVSADTRVGLDIELLDPNRDLAALAAQAFDADQCAWFAARNDACRVRDFYRLWSIKEARFKLGVLEAQCAELYHPNLAVVLCSAQPLSALPLLINKPLLP